MNDSILEKIHSPADVKQLNAKETNALCDEIRTFLIESVSKTGGHLSANLGTIELTVALHKVFTTPQDEIVFDVGHQCYTHKLLTGRKECFSQLRKLGGISGFPNIFESEHDAFIAGHGNTALSAGIGLARAKQLQHEPGKVIVIIGDGAFTGGMVYEGMNNIDTLDNLIVVLNDNKMSISKSVGAVSRYFTKLRTSPNYFKAKRDVEGFLNAIPLIGRPLASFIKLIKTGIRRVMYNSTMFEDMGFQYAGPVDGHDVDKLCKLFSAYRDEQDKPLFVHAVTVKGRGFTPAENNPGAFHGVSAFDLKENPDPDLPPSDSFSVEFGKELVELGKENEKICAVTAAMKYGVGMNFFYKEFPKRFFDVGMAEQHAVTFSAGLARGGMLPVVSIYSTFMQRSYDQIIHDVCLQRLNVLFCLDRAGLVPGDGETHQGVYDAAFLSQQSEMKIVSPCNYAELRYWLRELAEKETSPRAIRYPRGAENPRLAKLGCTGAAYDRIVAHEGAKTAIITYGAETIECLEAEEQLAQSDIVADVYKLTVINPLPKDLVMALHAYTKILFVEDTVAAGGIGEHMAEKLLETQYNGVYKHLALPNTGITHASVPELRKLMGIDAYGIACASKEG